MPLLANKKGIESFPFFLFLSILIAAVILTVSFYQIQSFSDFSAKKDMADSYQKLNSAMENLRSTADKGSFTKVSMKVPGNANITISPTNNTITITMGGQEIVNTAGVNITATANKDRTISANDLTLGPGDYQIIVYYGNATNTPEPYTIYFS